MKKWYVPLALLLAIVLMPAVYGQSYLDTVYQTQNATDTDPVQQLKDAISQEYDIEIADDPDVNRWSEDWLKAIQGVLAVLPEDFRSATRMIYLDPGTIPFEVKYNGFNEQQGIVQMGYGSIYPSSVYARKFNEVFGRLPNTSEKIARFKTILVRGMSYAYQQANPDIAQGYARIAQGAYSTKVYGPATDLHMVVAPGKTPVTIDMAFAVAEFCSSPSTLQTKSEPRFTYIKDYVMGGQTVAGWGNPQLEGSDPGNNNGGNDNPGGNVENPGTRPPPEIPDGDYLPVVTEVDVGTAAVTIPQDQLSAPELLKSAIVEIFSELPKFFSTCTEAIAYVPSMDTKTAFSSEGYVFITQNSWFMPSFMELDEAGQNKRFKMILIREMTLRFLFFHPEVTQKWKETFDESQSTFDAYVSMTEAVVYYYGNASWLKQLNPDRYNFVKTEIMQGKEF